MEKKLLEKIKAEISKSKSLGWSDKLEAEILLDTAANALETRDHLHVIKVLQSLYEEVVGTEYKEVIQEVLKKYRREVRALNLDEIPETPMVLRDFLKRLNIDSLKNLPDYILDSKLSVAIDDGMGYSPSGFRDVSDCYWDETSGEIRIWI